MTYRNLTARALTLAVSFALSTGAFAANARQNVDTVSVAVSKTVATFLGLKADPKFKTKYLVNSAELDTVKRKLHDAYYDTGSGKLASIYNAGYKTLAAL